MHLQEFTDACFLWELFTRVVLVFHLSEAPSHCAGGLPNFFKNKTV